MEVRKQSKHCKKLLYYIEQKATRRLEKPVKQERVVVLENVGDALLSSAREKWSGMLC